MVVTEEDVYRIAKFYKETRTWRGELALAGIKVDAKYVDYNHDEVLCVRNESTRKYWYVYLMRGAGFYAAPFSGRYREDGCETFQHSSEVMDFLSEEMRDDT